MLLRNFKKLVKKELITDDPVHQYNFAIQGAKPITCQKLSRIALTKRRKEKIQDAAQQNWRSDRNIQGEKKMRHIIILTKNMHGRQCLSSEDAKQDN